MPIKVARDMSGQVVIKDLLHDSMACILVVKEDSRKYLDKHTR